jgi:ubiquinol-cytochrome c reductase iron-sulfur subunit
MTPEPSPITVETPPKKTRRDFLMLATGAMGAVGATSLIWPFIDSMNPAADVLSQATVDVELKSIQPGQAITVMWQGKPIFIRRRTPEELKQVRSVQKSDLIDPQFDQERVKKGKDEWLVVIGVCTHLGCVPVGQKPTDNRGHYGGWFCPCHGSEYDASGRVRHGPAPKNLTVPPYVFLSETTIRIGQEQVA